MIVKVKKIDDIKRELAFEVPKERVAQKLDEVYQDLGKKAKIKGFRQGKVPRHVLETQHGRLAQEEVVQKLVPEIYQEGIAQEKLQPIDLPEILDVHFKDGVITFTAKLDIKPDVTIKDYKGIKVQRKSSEVTEEEINKTLEYLQKAQGEDKKVTLDDAFARGLGYPSLEDFKKSLSRQLEMDKDRHNRFDVENQIVDQLLKKAKLTVPESLVKKQLDRRIAEGQQKLKSQGMSEEEIKKKEEDMRKEILPSVEKDVKAYLVLDKIAELEQISVNEGENLPAKVIEFLLKEAKWEGAK